jgi:hypothetical protein
VAKKKCNLLQVVIPIVNGASDIDRDDFDGCIDGNGNEFGVGIDSVL